MHLGMSYTELQKLPVRYRQWYIKRLSLHFEKKNEMINSSNSNSNKDHIPLSKIEEIFNKKSV
jgi:hypothetical protein